MGEVLTDHNTQPTVSSPERVTPAGSLSYGDRLRQGLGRALETSLSLVDLGAGMVLALDDLRLTRSAMRQLDEPYDGLIERQASADMLSSVLVADIMVDFRRDAQAAGFTDVDAMLAEQRSDVATQSVEARAADIAAEVAALHTDWASEQIDAAVAIYVADTATVLGMDAQQRDAYLAAQLEYHELLSAIPEIRAELGNLRAERNERLMRIGGAAVRGIVGLAGRLRNAPTALGARAMLTGMAVGDRLGAMRPENRRKAFWGTAAGVAVAGLAGYVAMRAGVGHGSGSVLAGYNTPIVPDHVGTNLPDHIGTVVLPGHVGTPAVDHLGLATPTHVGGNSLPDHVGSSPLPDHLGSTTPPSATPDHVGAQSLPNHVGTTAPGNARVRSGQPLPNHVGTAAANNTPNHMGAAGTTVPHHVGGAENLAGATTSDQLFNSSAPVDAWPNMITVSHWNAHDLDGSLTGIAHQMLVRAGLHDPSQVQLKVLVDSMRPQARPNGYLLYGQRLDLRPAVKALQTLL